MDLKNKIINFLGDSITEGKGVSSDDCRFVELVQKKCGLLRANNYGVGGTCIAPNKVISVKAKHDMNFCGRCWLMDNNADVIIVFGGTNDYGHGDAPLGDPENFDRSTFSGSVHYLCKTINELYPKSTLVFMTPAHRLGDAQPSDRDAKPDFAEKRTLVEYVDMIKAIAPIYHFQILDMFNDFEVNPNKKEDYEKYTIDGLHFNDAGHAAIADKIISFLEAL